MLVISRNPGERINIIVPPSDSTQKIIIETTPQGTRVKVCIDAPKHIRVLRSELNLES